MNINISQAKENTNSNKNSILIPTSSKKISTNKQNETSLNFKSNLKSSCTLKNSHVRQLRNQPYATKHQELNQKAIKRNKDKSYQNIQNDSINEDDCWPFLCSLSVISFSNFKITFS